MNRAIHFKFGTEIEDGPKFGADIENGPLLCVDNKASLKWAWPWSRDPISKFWVRLIIFE